MFSWELSKDFKTFYFTNPIALVRGLHCRPLSYKLLTILEHSKGTCSWSRKILDCRPVTLEKNGQSCKTFFGVFENLEHGLLFQHFEKSIYNCFFSPIVGCRLYSCNCIKRELHYLCFFYTSTHKNVFDGLLFWQQPTIFLRMDLPIDVFFQFFF